MPLVRLLGGSIGTSALCIFNRCSNLASHDQQQLSEADGWSGWRPWKQHNLHQGSTCKEQALLKKFYKVGCEADWTALPKEQGPDGCSKQRVLGKLKKVVSARNRLVVLHYCGPSDGHGNPCFANQEVLAFAELVHAWRQLRAPMQHLVVVLDCPGAGAWVGQLAALPAAEQLTLSMAVQALDCCTTQVDSVPAAGVAAAVQPPLTGTASAWLVQQQCSQLGVKLGTAAAKVNGSLVGTLPPGYHVRCSYKVTWGAASLTDFRIPLAFMDTAHTQVLGQPAAAPPAKAAACSHVAQAPAAADQHAVPTIAEPQDGFWASLQRMHEAQSSTHCDAAGMDTVMSEVETLLVSPRRASVTTLSAHAQPVGLASTPALVSDRTPRMESSPTVLPTLAQLPDALAPQLLLEVPSSSVDTGQQLQAAKEGVAGVQGNAPGVLAAGACMPATRQAVLGPAAPAKTGQEVDFQERLMLKLKNEESRRMRQGRRGGVDGELQIHEILNPAADDNGMVSRSSSALPWSGPQPAGGSLDSIASANLTSDASQAAAGLRRMCTPSMTAVGPTLQATTDFMISRPIVRGAYVGHRGVGTVSMEASRLSHVTVAGAGQPGMLLQKRDPGRSLVPSESQGLDSELLRLLPAHAVMGSGAEGPASERPTGLLAQHTGLLSGETRPSGRPSGFMTSRGQMLSHIPPTAALAMLQALRSNDGRQVISCASPSLLHHVLMATNSSSFADLGEPSPPPATRRPGRTQMQGHEEANALFSDDVARWEYLKKLVAGEPELEQELQELQPEAMSSTSSTHPVGALLGSSSSNSVVAEGTGGPLVELDTTLAGDQCVQLLQALQVRRGGSVADNASQRLLLHVLEASDSARWSCQPSPDNHRCRPANWVWGWEACEGAGARSWMAAMQRASLRTTWSVGHTCSTWWLATRSWRQRWRRCAPRTTAAAATRRPAPTATRATPAAATCGSCSRATCCMAVCSLRHWRRAQMRGRPPAHRSPRSMPMCWGVAFCCPPSQPPTCTETRAPSKHDASLAGSAARGT